jgi:thiol-disulfide isomerase/thioredoxin
VLPPGTAAPDVQFVRIDNDSKVRLADFHGKVVLLEFWATWCGPCQEPMAKLQTLRQKHPSWKDRVEIIALSIDDEMKQARDHLQKRNWTNTFAAWAGPGGWRSDPAKSFRVSGVPTTYLLNGEGKVAWAGHPRDDMANAVDALLRMDSRPPTTAAGGVTP